MVSGEEKVRIENRIRRLRGLILGHSRIQHELHERIISATEWQIHANQLRDLQKRYPECTTIKFFDSAFKGWDASSGISLPLSDPWVVTEATNLLNDAGF